MLRIFKKKSTLRSTERNTVQCAHVFSLSLVLCISHAILWKQQQANSLQQLFHLHIALPLVGFICFMHLLQLPCLASRACLFITSLLWQVSYTSQVGCQHAHTAVSYCCQQFLFTFSLNVNVFLMYKPYSHYKLAVARPLT